jgi:hypothetical protein
MIEGVTKRKPRRNTVEGILLFLGQAKKNSKGGIFEASRDFGADYVSRIKLAGGEGICLLPFLIRIGIIEKVTKHWAEGHRACKYRFLQNNWKTYKIPLTPTSWRKLQSSRERKRNRLIKDKERTWVEKSLGKAYLPMKEIEGMGERHRPANKALLEGNHWIKTRHGRITTVFSNIPSNLREQIQFGDEQASRLDISTSHPLMLCSYIDSLIKDGGDRWSKLARSNELEQFRRFLEGPDPYTILLPGIDRKKAKKEIQTFLNGKNGRYSRRAYGALKDRFPLIAKTIHSHIRTKPMGPFLQAIENQVIRQAIGRLGKRDIFIIPCVDEILVPWSQRETALEILSNAVWETTGIHPKIGGVRIKMGCDCPKWWEDVLMALLAS